MQGEGPARRINDCLYRYKTTVTVDLPLEPELDVVPAGAAVALAGVGASRILHPAVRSRLVVYLFYFTVCKLSYGWP